MKFPIFHFYKGERGRIVVFVTSKGTLGKKDESFRMQLAEKVDLIGAVRLPNSAFTEDGSKVNNYFAENSEMILGTIVEGNKLYDRNDDTMCIPIEGSDL